MNVNQIIKFIIITAIFYALLAFNVFHIGEKLVPSPKDYVEIELPQAEIEDESDNREIPTSLEEQTGHFAASDILNLETICNTISICDKIDFKGSFSDNERYNYTKTISKIVQFIDRNSDEDETIENVIDTIEISKENGKRRGYATRDSIIFNI
jgi:hypothetical protein